MTKPKTKTLFKTKNYIFLERGIACTLKKDNSQIKGKWKCYSSCSNLMGDVRIELALVKL